MSRGVVTGLNLSDRNSGGSVEHIVLTLLDRLQPGMADGEIGAIRTLYGQVSRARTCRTLEGLPEKVFLLGRESVLEQSHRKAVLCWVRSIARTQAITCSIVCCEKSVNARVVRGGSRRPARKVSVI